LKGRWIQIFANDKVSGESVSLLLDLKLMHLTYVGPSVELDDSSIIETPTASICITETPGQHKTHHLIDAVTGKSFYSRQAGSNVRGPIVSRDGTFFQVVSGNLEKGYLYNIVHAPPRHAAISDTDRLRMIELARRARER